MNTTVPNDSSNGTSQGFVVSDWMLSTLIVAVSLILFWSICLFVYVAFTLRAHFRDKCERRTTADTTCNPRTANAEDEPLKLVNLKTDQSGSTLNTTQLVCATIAMAGDEGAYVDEDESKPKLNNAVSNIVFSGRALDQDGQALERNHLNPIGVARPNLMPNEHTIVSDQTNLYPSLPSAHGPNPGALSSRMQYSSFSAIYEKGAHTSDGPVCATQGTYNCTHLKSMSYFLDSEQYINR